MSSCRFNGIIVLDSLDDNKTAINLFKDLEYLKLKFDHENTGANFYIKHLTFANLKELKNIIEEINADCLKYNVSPIIHIECHGSLDSTGLILKDNKSLLDWKTMAMLMRKINITTRHNLIVGMSVCFGAHLIEGILPTEPAPFWGVFGSTSTIYEKDLVALFSRLYREIIEEKRVMDIVKNIDKDYESKIRFEPSERLFLLAFNSYLAQLCNPGTIATTMRTHNLALKVSFSDPKWTYQEARRFAEKFLFDERSKRQSFEKYANIYFMKKFEENKERFVEYTYDWVKNFK